MSSCANARSAPLYHQLPPGPGAMRHDQVVAHQRARLRLAMIEGVSQRGYAATTVRDLTNLAGVSTRTFYERYSGKHECFLATYELIVARMARCVRNAQYGELDPGVRLRLAFATLAREIADDPKAAQLALIEILQAGPAAMERMERAKMTFAGALSCSFVADDGDRGISSTIACGLVDGLTHVARTRVVDHRTNELPELVEELATWALSFGSVADHALVQRDANATALVPFTVRNLRGRAKLEQICMFVGELVDRLVADRTLAKTIFLEAAAVGPRGCVSGRELLRKLNLASLDSGSQPSSSGSVAVEASVGAVWGTIHNRIVRNRLATLPALKGLLCYMLLTPQLGAENAADALR